MKSTRWYELTTFTHGSTTYMVYIKKKVNGLHKFKTKKVNRINSTFGINFHVTKEQQQKNLEAMEEEFEVLLLEKSKYSQLKFITPPRGE